MSRESRNRVRVMVRVSVMTAYFFSFRSLACVGQCLVDQIIYHVTNYWCHAKLGLGLELGLVYCSLLLCLSKAYFANVMISRETRVRVRVRVSVMTEYFF